ncbi:MAG: BTAD domain-containing putative transcriptional regulator, partial [Anaerolineales bacterium]
MSQRLKLTTLGEFTIRLDGAIVKGLASRKAEALFVYLAVTQQVHAREHLATLLWDDRPLGRSLGNLSVVVNSLKKHLASFLEIERSTISIKTSENIWVDVHESKVALEQFLPSNHAESSRREQDISRVEEALGWYRGDFLQGFHIREARGFDEWVSLERERIQRQVLTSWRALADTYLHIGDLDSAIRVLKSALEIDPLQEGLHRELMQNLALSGQHGAALAQYRECAAVLKAELDVEPALATRRLYDRILARRERPLDNLPSLATTTIGRQDEVKEIHNRLREPNTRLLTLVGVGGIGKTRLALEVAISLHDAFFEGLWFVDLAPVEDPELVPQAIERVLAMPDRPSAADMLPREGMLARLLDFLETKDLLLILDNCEHLLDTCVPITERLLRHCPGLKILVTSRERFDLPEEHLFIVEPLIIPEDQTSLDYDIDSLRENESIRLFEERAQAVRKPFALNERNADILVRICRTLDGMPLAIELTASRLRSLSLTQIAENLEESVQSFGRDHQGAVPRHQTLEAAIDWSYHLLNEEEQRLFRQATIFRGGFDLPALIEVSRALGFDPGLTEAIL